VTGGGRTALWPPGKGECWLAATAGYSRVRWPGRAPGSASGGRSLPRHRHWGAVAAPLPARAPVVAVRAGGRAVRPGGGPPWPETGGRPGAADPFDPAVPRSGSAPEPVVAVRARPPGCRRRCSQQHHAPSGPSKHPRGLKPCEPLGVAAVVPVPGRRASEQSPEPVAPAVTTRPPPPGPPRGGLPRTSLVPTLPPMPQLGNRCRARAHLR